MTTFDASVMCIDEGIHAAAIYMLLNKLGRPTTALMNINSLMSMAQSFGYHHSDRVKWHDGTIDVWLPSGWLEIRPDISQPEKAAVLYNSEGFAIVRVGLSS